MWKLSLKICFCHRMENSKYTSWTIIISTVIESSKFEKIFKITESNHQPSKPSPITKSCPMLSRKTKDDKFKTKYTSLSLLSRISQNHRIVGVGRDLQRSLSPTPRFPHDILISNSMSSLQFLKFCSIFHLSDFFWESFCNYDLKSIQFHQFPISLSYLA